MTSLRMIATAIALFFTLVTPREDVAQTGLRQTGPDDLRQTVTTIVAKIQRADYEGDRAALKRLHDELTPFVTPATPAALASRVLYWRGFALWRRAFNTFGADSPDLKDADNDLTQAAADFHDAVARDPAFIDAKIAEASCLVNSAVINKGTDRGRELWERSAQLMKEAAAAPDNPRLLWVRGANEWWAPPGQGGGQAVAFATYQRGLELARQQKGRVTDPLEPTWGEPELLMTLAYADLHRTTPDIAAAERYAREALALVPYWHYVRDVLMVQIKASK